MNSVTGVIGRDRELDRLRERTRTRTARVTFVIGTAGIGKSALLRAFAQTTAGVRLVEIESAERVPLTLLLEALEIPIEDFKPGDPAGANAELLDGFVRLADGGVRALVLDNAHALDIASLDFLRTALEHDTNLPLHLIVSTRPSEQLAPGAQHQFVRGAESDVRAMRLVALEDGDIETLIATRVGTKFTAEQLRWFVSHAEGNPHTALEFAEASALSHERGFQPVSENVAAAVRLKLSRLSEADAHAVRVAAAIGRRFDPALLAGAAGVAPLDIVGALNSGLRAGLLAHSEQTGEIQFRHEITRDAVYASLLALERGELHATIAGNVEALAASASVDAIAYDQWVRAGRFDRAEPPGRRTAQHALDRFAYDDAVAVYRRLYAIAEHREDRARLLDSISHAYFYAGNLTAAREVLAEAIEMCAASKDRELRASLAYRYAVITQHVLGTAAGYDAFDSISSLLGQGSTSPWLFRTYATIAYDAVQAGRFATASEFLARADELSSNGLGVEDHAVHRLALSAQKAVLGDVGEWMRWSDRALELEIEGGKVNRRVSARIVRAFQARALGQLTIGMTAAVTASREAERSRLSGLAANAQVTVAWLELESGSIAEAHERARRAADLGGVAAWIASIVLLYSCAHLLDCELFDRLTSADPLESARSNGNPVDIGMVGSALAAACYAFDRRERARDALRAVLGSITLPYACGDGLALAPELGSMEDVESARALFKAGPLGPRDGAYAELFEARVARREGRERRATAHGLAAARAFEALGMRIAQAEALDAAGRRAAALALAVDIGDRALERRIAGARAARNARGREVHALTRRELQIATLVGGNLTNRDIAAQLAIGERTVETHVATILRKTGATTRREIGEFLRQPVRF